MFFLKYSDNKMCIKTHVVRNPEYVVVPLTKLKKKMFPHSKKKDDRFCFQIPAERSDKEG